MEKIFNLIQFLGSRILYPIAWTIIVIGLLCIPGKSLPGLGLLGIKHLDKIIHIFLFGGFVLLWGIYAWNNKGSVKGWLWTLVLICLISLVIGIVMEFIQAAFIPQRSFDVWDIWADLVGSLLFAYLLQRWGGPWKLLAQ